MKVRVKLSGTAKAVQIGDYTQFTLKQLRERTAEVFEIAQETPFVLSLNQQDAITGDDQTLAQLDIVPGDLIFVLIPMQLTCDRDTNASRIQNVGASASSSNSSDRSSVRDTSDPALNLNDTSSVFHSMDNGSREQEDLKYSDSNTDTTSREDYAVAGNDGPLVADHTEDGSGGADLERATVSPSPLEDPVVNRCLQEPLLCRESSPNSVSALLRDMFTSAGCSTMSDALWVVVHTLMMEVGFRPLQGANLSLAQGWNRCGFYRQEYRHLYVSMQHSCSLVGVPMGGMLIIHGVTSTDHPVKTEPQQLRVMDYVQEQSITQDVYGIFKNLERLSRTVKDSVCQQLLSQLSDVCGFPVSLGLLSLPYEVKLKVLSYLPAGSLVTMGQLCRQYNSAYKDPCLWRRLYLREFGQCGNNSLNKDWYQLYKEAYLMRKERRRMSRHRQHVLTGIPPWLNPPPGHFPPLAPAPYPSGIIGGDYDLNPEGMPSPLFVRPRTPSPFLPQGPGGPFLPRPRFDDPFGPGAGPLGSRASRNSHASLFGSFGGNRLF